MIRKKKVSFKEDLVERIPNSFSQGLEVNEEVFITEFTQVFIFTGVFQLVECRWNSLYTHWNLLIFGFDIQEKYSLKLFPFVCRTFYLLLKPLSARLERVMMRQIN